MPKVVREHEVLRVAALIRGVDQSALATKARGEVLRWTQKRCGGNLPKEAWDQETFEYFSGGRNTNGVRIITGGVDIWSIRTDDPDKTIAGRTWTTEIVIAQKDDEPPKFSTRLLVSTSEDALDIAPHSPGFIQQITEEIGLYEHIYPIEAHARLIQSDDDAHSLIEQLLSPNRKLPIFVLTVSERASDPAQPLLDAEQLARATLGIGHIVILPAIYTRILVERFGRLKAVFGGAVRAYLPGFSEDSSPYAHKLIIAEQLSSAEQRLQCERWIRSTAAHESIRRQRMGIDVVPFASIRSSALELKQQRLAQEGASDNEQLQAAQARISALELQITDEKTTSDYVAGEYDEATLRAEAAEDQLRASTFRIQQLLEQIGATGDIADANIEPASSWEEFANWADTNLAGRVVLTPSARRMVKAPEFEDFGLVSKCLLWLANTGRERRINGGQGSIREEVIEEGVRNTHCGSDEFEFDWQAAPYSADWHIKNGGNTRDPARCLRIYYSWDPNTQQIIIPHLPSHRRTGAS
jgi:hypothetical protein